MLRVCTIEKLGRGIFNHGSEGPNDLSDDKLESSVFNKPSIFEVNEQFKHFSREFPLIPQPPIPPLLHKGKGYFEAPKSAVEILAEQKIAQEKLEFEENKKATEENLSNNLAEIENLRTKNRKLKAQSSKNKIPFKNDNTFNDQDDNNQYDDVLSDDDNFIFNENNMLVKRKRGKRMVNKALRLLNTNDTAAIEESNRQLKINRMIIGSSARPTMLLSPDNNPEGVYFRKDNTIITNAMKKSMKDFNALNGSSIVAQIQEFNKIDNDLNKYLVSRLPKVSTFWSDDIGTFVQNSK